MTLANAKSSKQGVGPLNKENKVIQVTFKNEIILKCFFCNRRYSLLKFGCPNCLIRRLCHSTSLESGIDVGPGKIGKKNKRRALK